MDQDYDIVVIGAGMIGLALANDLAKEELRIAIVDESVTLFKSLDPNHPEIRASAINHSSEAYLKALGIWSDLMCSQRVLTYDRIDVKEREGKAKLEATSYDLGYANLGHIIENQLIQNQLYARLQAFSNVHFIVDSMKELDNRLERCFIYLQSGRAICAQLVIGADGAHSITRKEGDALLLSRPYKHHAIVATIETSKPHLNCAKQLFYGEGIVAFLPLFQKNRHCLVWSLTPKQADKMISATQNEFNAALTELTQQWQGECKLISDRVKFPLIARFVPKPVQSRLILIGDAAHTIHPLAGQGANLGFRDAKQLGKTIRSILQIKGDLGNSAYYRAYLLERDKDSLELFAGMQTIQDFFAGDFKPKKWMRTLGMNLIDHSAWIKKKLIKKALGL